MIAIFSRRVSFVFVRRLLSLFDYRRIGRQIFSAQQINRQSDQHADARCTETPVPAINFAECSGNQRRGDDSAVDKDVVNLEGIGAAIVAGGVKRADLTGEIAFKTTDAAKQTSQREEKRHIERHQEMSGRHQQRADGDCAGASEPTIRDQSAGDRREINQTGVETEDGRGERLDDKRAAKDLDQMAKRAEPRDLLDVAGKQQPIDHVEHEQRLHAVVGETLPRFGERDVTQTARMPEKLRSSRIMHGGESETKN